MPINRVTDIIIGKDVASGDGFVRVLNDQMAALSPGDTIADSPIIYIEQTLVGGTNKLISLPIHGRFVRNWTGKSAVNAVNQVTTIANITPISDQEFGIYITLTSDKDLSLGNRRYYFQYVTDASATVAEIVTGLTATINATTSPLYGKVTASGSTTLVLTGNNATVYFTVGKAIGFDAATTVTTGTPWSPGSGTYDEVFALEDKAKGYKGYMSERRTFVGDLPGFGRPTYFTAGTPYSITSVYDQYLIDHDQPIDLQGINASNAKPTTTYICIPKAASTFPQGSFEAILNPWFASCPGAFNAVNL